MNWNRPIPAFARFTKVYVGSCATTHLARLIAQVGLLRQGNTFPVAGIMVAFLAAKAGYFLGVPDADEVVAHLTFYFGAPFGGEVG